MNPRRFFRHLLIPRWWARRVFHHTDLAAITAAISAIEQSYRGELCFAIEGPLPFGALRRGTSARERAVELFSRLGVDRTAERSGILIYVQLVDRRMEILADSGIAGRVPQAEWETICRGMEADFRAGEWRRGAVAAVEHAGTLLAAHFPAAPDNPNELPDKPIVF